jgi:hypothetical protein
MNPSFRNSEKLIKGKNFGTPFYTQKISMPLTDLVFEKWYDLSHIRYHIKGCGVTEFGILT